MKIRVLMFLLIAINLNVMGQSNQKHSLKANMDLSIKPGTDFYQYAVGNWIKNNPLPAAYPRYGQFDRLNKLNNERIRNLIKEMSLNNYAENTDQKRIGDLYNLFIDSTRRNNDGIKPLLPLLNTINQIKNIREYQIIGGKLSLYDININIFRLWCGVDKENATKNLIYISQGGLSLGNRDYYLLQDSVSIKIRNHYKDYIAKLFELAGYSTDTAKLNATQILDFEIKIANASKSLTELRNTKENFNKISYFDLINTYNTIDWGNILLQSQIPAIDSISVNQPEFIKEVENIFKQTDIELLKTYAKFNILNFATNLLDDEFNKTQFLLNQVITGAKQDKPRWEKAVAFVNNSLGMAVGKYYVEKYFPETSKTRMLDIVKNLQTALHQRIEETKWMNDTTKQKAFKKLEHFYVKIGYPDKWIDYSGLKIDPQKSLLENTLEINYFTNIDYINKHVNKPTNRDDWHMTPQTVNAYYNPTTNEICFPAGILQPPFFDPEADEACNFGAIGAVIGHEMTHGFDDQGAQYDYLGNLNNWWTQSDSQQFEKRTDVMRKFFDKIEVLPGVHCNGSLTLGENIADNGGLNVSFRAMQNYMLQHNLENKEGFTPEQRFFISWAITWAENRTTQSIRDQIKNDPHSNAKWRVNGQLPHIAQWYKAFNIKQKDKMFLNTYKRVEVW